MKKVHCKKKLFAVLAVLLVTAIGCTRRGGISNNAGVSIHPCVAINRGGKPVVAWYDDTRGYFQVYVRCWDLTAWADVGCGTTNPRRMHYDDGLLVAGPSLAFDLAGNPIVAASDDQEIYVWRHDGAAWVHLMAEGPTLRKHSGMSDTRGASAFPSVIIDTAGNPIVAWGDDTSGKCEIYVRRWNGASWVEMGRGSATGGGISNTPGNSSYPAMAVDEMGNPIVTWVVDTDGDQFNCPDAVYVRKWDGKAWVEMGAGSAAALGIDGTKGESRTPSIATDRSGNAVVAWAENVEGRGAFPSDGEIYVRRWDGKAWLEIGEGSATGGGISNTGGDSKFPSVTIDRDGNPIVAWDERVYKDTRGCEIYVRRWNGSAWVEIGTNSASEGGISNTRHASRCPSIAIAGDGNPVVVWQESVNGNWEIFVRRWDGKSWVEMGKASASKGR